jgi:hypothetical protein
MPLVDDSMDESTPWLIEKLRERYASTDSGLIIDTEIADAHVWCITLPAFEKWFSELETITSQTLGRRLAYAAAESEEWLWSLALPLPNPWIGKEKKRIATINFDWATRGLGQLEMLESTSEGTTLLVANRGQTAIAAGMGNAAWERIQDARFRFQWSDRGAGETIVQATIDPREIPSAKNAHISWTNCKGNISNDKRLFNRARHETAGVWTVEGNRVMMLQADLLYRFEALTTPYLAETPRNTDPRTEWIGLSEIEKIVLWDSMAEASRKQFLASGELVLVAEPEHWIAVANRYLALQGLGCVTSAIGIDEHGGVDLHISAALHPAIVVGRLIGCWERAEGRPARASWSTDSDGHQIRLESRREIAE